ncbi:MAG: hypothetical protein H6523_13095 [Mycolicibacterium sp.]|nr:hypothetical protein [Mycolicibacterium sp.]
MTTWEGPGKEFVDAGGGQLFANLRAAFDPAEIRKGLDDLGRTVSGNTPDAVFEHVLMPSVTELAKAQGVYLLGEGGFNDLHNAVYGWHSTAEARGFDDEAMTAADARRRQAQAAIMAAIDAGRDPSDEEVSENHASADVFAKKLRERTAADEKLTADVARIAAGLISSAAGVGEKLSLEQSEGADKKKPGSPSAPSAPGATPPGSPGAPPAPGSPGTPGPRMSPSGVPGDVPGVTPKSPEAQAEIERLMKSVQNQQQPQGQQQQQPTATAAPTASPTASQSKPTSKAKSDADDPIQRMLADIDARSGDTGMPPLAAAAAVPDVPPARAPIDPPAPKPQVGGNSYTGGQTTANTTGGQNRAPMTLASAVPVQETVNPAQRSGVQQPLGGQGGVPMAPGYGSAPQQGAGKEQPKVAKYIKQSETELVASGAYAVDEAVKGGTICRGDHVDDEDDPKNKGPRQR